MGKFIVETWYFSPLPREIWKNESEVWGKKHAQRASERDRDGVRTACARQSENASESESAGDSVSESAREGKQDSESENENMRARERIRRGGGWLTRE